MGPRGRRFESGPPDQDLTRGGVRAMIVLTDEEAKLVGEAILTFLDGRNVSTVTNDEMREAVQAGIAWMNALGSGAGS